MTLLIVGSMSAKKGIEYSGFVPLGNSFLPTEKVRLSVNRTPFATVFPKEPIYSDSNFTYSFEKDTTIFLTRSVQDDHSIIWNNKCLAVVQLAKDTESATICSVIAREAVTTGLITCVANILNDNGSDKEVIIKAYVDGTEVSTITNELEKRRETQTVLEFLITTPLTKNQVVSFKIEAKANNMIIEGGNYPSQIQVKRTS